MATSAPDSLQFPVTHADRVRQQILEGAVRAFSASGYQKTSVPSIAAEAGVSVGLLYRYYTGKADLFSALCTWQMDSEAESVRQALGQIDDPRQRLEHAVDLYLRRLQTADGAGLILGALAESPANEVVRLTMKRRRETVKAFVVGYLDEGMARGELEPGTPVQDFAESIAMLLDGAVTAYAVEGDGVDPARIKSAIVNLLAAALPTRSMPGGRIGRR